MPDVSPTQLGYHIAQLRERAGLKQAELARRVTLSQAVLSRVESGERRLSDDELASILEAIGTPEAKALADVASRVWRALPAPELDHPDVRTYFADMQIAFRQMRRHALLGARMFFDIGDSRYCGVHVPTHKFLAEIAFGEGWSLADEEVIRTRRSYDGSKLTQVLLHFVAA